MRTLARSHAGLRSPICEPLGDAGLGQATEKSDRRACGDGHRIGAGTGVGARTVPAPRRDPVAENGARSLSRCAPHDVGALDGDAARPTAPCARATTASTTSRIVTSTPSAASEVTALSGMPHGTM